MKTLISVSFAVLAAASVLTAGISALANPRPLPFTYQHEQLGTGESEVEQFVDVTPTRALDAASGKPIWYGLTEFTTEFETGVTDSLELGLYVTFAPAASSDFYHNAPQAMEGNGIKQRLRWSMAPAGLWPIDVSLYGETSENEREFELEAKVLLQRRLGIVRLIANLGGEQEYYYRGHQQDFVLNPSAGVTFEASQKIQPGLEAWMQGEWPEIQPPHPRPFELGPHVYVGPTLLWQIGRIWWSNGVYLRATNRSYTLLPDRSGIVQQADSFGNVWVRTVIGIGL